MVELQDGRADCVTECLYALEKLRKLLLEIEHQIGRNVCADPVIDIILAIAIDNARGRAPSIAEAILASGSTTDTTRRFVDVLIARNVLRNESNGGLTLHPRLQATLDAGLKNFLN